MSTLDREFIEAFSEVVKEQVSRKRTIELQGLGTFEFEHRKQHQKQFDNGRVVMMPPKDTIRFIPEQ